MVVWARSAPEKQKTVTTQTARTQIPLLPQSHRLRIFAPWISVDHHWQDSGFFGFFLALAAGRFRALPADNISQRSMLKNFGCSIANIQEHLVKRAVLGIAINQAAKLFGVAERRQWAIDQADNLAKTNFPRRSPQLVPTIAPRTLSTMRAFFISSRMSSRNFSGRSSSYAMSRMRIAPWL